MLEYILRRVSVSFPFLVMVESPVHLMIRDWRYCCYGVCPACLAQPDILHAALEHSMLLWLREKIEMHEDDKYKEDWIDSLVFKRAMKAEAIKRGVHVDSEWEVDEEEERVAMTNADAVTLQGDADQDNSACSVDELDMANA